MKLTILSCLLLLINELLANPTTQKYTGYLNYNSYSHNHKARKIEPTTQGQTYIEDFPDYPKNFIQSLNLEKFEHLFGDDYIELLDLRFDADEQGLCSSRKRLIHPKRGMTSNGTWLTIVNNDDDRYRQGILVEECDQQYLPCQYSQNFPLSVESKCKQSFTYRSLLAITFDGRPVMEHFQFPSCCKCVVTVGHRSGNRNRFGDVRDTRGSTVDDKIIFPH